MILTGLTQADYERAIREESLLKGKDCHKRAVEEVAKCMWEHSIAEWSEFDNPQERWNTLPRGAKYLELKNATWLIGRLALEGLNIVKGRA